MTPSDFNADERIALMGLLKLTVGADNKMSDGESDELLRIADEIGRAEFIEARKDAQEQLNSVDEIKSALKAIARPEAQRLMYRCALDVARPDEVVDDEAEVLRWVAKAWGLTVDPATFQLVDDPK